MQFRLSDPEWRYAESREVGPITPERVRVGVVAVNADCGGCAHSWRERRPRNTIGGVAIRCPNCGASGVADLSALEP